MVAGLHITLVLVLACLHRLALANSVGCGKTPKLVSGRQTMTVNNKQRQWILRIPQGYNSSTPYRVIFGLHWLSGTYESVDSGGQGSLPYYGLVPLANSSAIFISPDGLDKGWANQGGEDITFIQNIIKAVDEDLCVNEKLRFSMGFSYGGGMSYSVACTLPSQFRAVAILSGALLSGCSGGKEPVAFYIQHGIRDNVLNITSGRQIRETFVKNNGCSSSTAEEPARGSGSHIKTVYSGCSTGYPLQWIAFDEGHLPLPKDSGQTDSWTPNEVWAFFSDFS